MNLNLNHLLIALEANCGALSFGQEAFVIRSINLWNQPTINSIGLTLILLSIVCFFIVRNLEDMGSLNMEFENIFQSEFYKDHNINHLERHELVTDEYGYVKDSMLLISSLGEPDGEDGEDDYIFIKERNSLVKTLLADITHFEGFGDYIKLHTIDKIHVLNIRLSEVEERFKKLGFIRVHRSYIIRLSKIDMIKNKKVIINNSEIPVSNSHWDYLIEMIPKF